MTVSAFELFKIGIGPSSSHTVGPMIAAKRFRSRMSGSDTAPHEVRATLFGSLAWTGKGHGTDSAICLGLLGQDPETVRLDSILLLLNNLASTKSITLGGGRKVAFDPATSLHSEKKSRLKRHSNAMRFQAISDQGALLFEQTFYSIGGGFIVTDDDDDGDEPKGQLPYPFQNSADLLQLALSTGYSIAELQFANEQYLIEAAVVREKLDVIRSAMFDCIDRGLKLEGELPGGLKVRRRAPILRKRLLDCENSNTHPPHERMDWVSVFAIAVNEENASGGRVVTAPTNGAAGIIPAVLRYYKDNYADYSDENSRTFLLTAAAIGSLIKMNASISGAEVGCQGEVGSAAAMAAAGLAAVSGGTPAQVENAAEIALEHHLGMTCDPIGGLVQIPCIERNAIGAQKAIVAASLALKGDGTHRVTLDEAIRTMRETGADMQEKYKETSLGGLAVNVAEC